MWGPDLRRTFEDVTRPERLEMHGSLHLILATEADRSRRAAAEQARLASTLRRPFAAIRARVSSRAAAHGSPPRAAPGPDSPALGRQPAASLRGR